MKKRFFSVWDGIAGLLTFVITLGVYISTLAPSVTMEDSGELIVAADYLGVPHPPGYPIWTLLSWLFQSLFSGVTYLGHPNPAWAVNLFSAVAGATACGVLALLISRSGKDLLQNQTGAEKLTTKSTKITKKGRRSIFVFFVPSWLKVSADLPAETRQLFCCVAGICGGLLLAFAQGMWSQSVIAEVYSLNILFQSLVLLFLYRWMAKDSRPVWLICCAFFLGLGITNHQTLLFMGLAMATAVFFRDLKLARDFSVVSLFFILLVLLNKVCATHAPNWCWVAGPDHIGFWFWTLYAVLIPLFATFLLPNGKVVGPVFFAIEAGLAFYLYMPLASAQHPPMNWGYACTWEGFINAITRDQYARVTLANVFSAQFWDQVGAYLVDLRSQFYWPIAALAAIPLLCGWRSGRRYGGWLITTLVAFLSVGIVFMILQNPQTDVNSLFIGRVQYIQSHAIYVLWIAYGILLLMAGLQTLVKNNRYTRVIGSVLVLLLPGALIYKNYHDEAQFNVVGGAEQNGHDFGWQFGHWQLQGVEGIKADLQAELSPEEFEQTWAGYPNPEYPPPMETNAIFFGGTDPGRFIPTYMIYSAKVRPDIYLITQNALANYTYTNEVRDLYGEQIWTPSQIDHSMAFRQFVHDVQTGKYKASNSVVKDGKIIVQGSNDVMRINGYLTRMIFDHNQFITESRTNEATRPPGAAVVPADPIVDASTGLPPERAFYVEESSPIPWMYPYLTPHGLIMKINSKPTPLTAQHVRDDHQFWSWYSQRLLNDEKFLRDVAARRSFSNLRAALGNLLAAKGQPRAAEAAFRQAIDLYPLSTLANLRLAMLLTRQNRHAEALELLQNLAQNDPNNEIVGSFLKQLTQPGGA